MDSVEVLFGGAGPHLRVFRTTFFVWPAASSSPGRAATAQALVATRGRYALAAAAWRSATAAK